MVVLKALFVVAVLESLMVELKGCFLGFVMAVRLVLILAKLMAEWKER